MKISYNWLQEYLPLNLSAEKIAEYLTDTGLEVEGVDVIETIEGGLKGVVVGEVVSCEPHPNADKLKVTRVDIGQSQTLQIVCGADNVAVGQKVPVATIGTLIYTHEGNFEIKKSKLRGVVSEGMICAEDELNLGESHDGIMILDPSAESGTPASEYFNIESDLVLEIGLTPNRSDAMSHYGVARDLRAALLRYDFKDVNLSLPSVSSFSVLSKDLPIDIKIENSEACPRYAGVSLKNIKVGPSPDWLQNRLRAIGLSPINNIVDITNFVMHETGHPLHAFDVDKIEGHRIIVKTANEGSKFITLDGKERDMHSDDLMICNEKEPMVIAGIFGGKKAGVNEATTKVFIESAYFNPVNVRKTAKRHGLNTDASFRYERGVDPGMTIYALKRAAILMRDIAGGEIAMDIKDEYPVKLNDFEVELDLQRMKDLIGAEIPLEMVRNILKSLDIQIKSEVAGNLLLNVPAYRTDVQREADVIEEVLRIYGFNAVEFGSKMNISIAQSDRLSAGRFREKISELLSSRGFAEIMNNSLTKASYFQKHGFNPEASVTMLNPLSRDLSVLRQSLVYGGLESIAYNSNRQNNDLRLYEFGKVYSQQNGNYKEKQSLAMWISGLEQPEGWKYGRTESDFFTLKAEVDGILAKLGLNGTEEKEKNTDLFEYSLSILLNNQEVALLGSLDEKLRKQMDIRQEVYYAEINWEYIVKKARKNIVRFADIPRYPSVRRDLALLLDKGVNYSDLKASALKIEKKLLKQVNLFDVYEGKNLPEGKKSYALSFTLRDDSKTLNDKQVDKVMEKILDKYRSEFKAELR